MSWEKLMSMDREWDAEHADLIASRSQIVDLAIDMWHQVPRENREGAYWVMAKKTRACIEMAARDSAGLWFAAPMQRFHGHLVRISDDLPFRMIALVDNEDMVHTGIISTKGVEPK